MNKNLIQMRFAKSLNSYNDNAKIQKKMAQRLLEFVSKKKYNNVLEIGCGTGFLTKLFEEKFEYETYTAIDLVPECQTFITEINPKIKFVSMDIEEFLVQNLQKFDLIIANASLQWVKDFYQVINNLKDRLEKNGELIFSTFGKENFKEIYLLTEAHLDYFSTEDFKQIFPQSTIIPEIHIMAFDSPKDVLKHIQLTGVNAIESKSWTKRDLAEFENGYRNLCSNKATLTYNPIYVKIETGSK